MNRAERRRLTKRRVVGLTGASVFATTGLFAGYVGNPRVPRAYAIAHVRCATGYDNIASNYSYLPIADEAMLSYAINKINGNHCDEITFASGSTIALTSSIAAIAPAGADASKATDTIYVDVDGADGVTIEANGNAGFAFDLSSMVKADNPQCTPDQYWYCTTKAVDVSAVTVNGASTAGSGAAINVVGGTLHVRNSTFSNNSAGVAGGAISIRYDGGYLYTPYQQPSAYGVTFTNNDAMDGGAVSISGVWEGGFTFAVGKDAGRESSFTLNDATDGDGGAIDISATAVHGGRGVGFYGGGSFTYNTATGDGGVVHVARQVGGANWIDVRSPGSGLTGSVFDHNDAGGSGGALYGDRIYGYYGQFTNNSAGVRGGAIFSHDNTKLKSARVSSNTANGDGGGLSVGGGFRSYYSTINANVSTTGIGGGARVGMDSHIFNTTVYGNSAAAEAGGLYITDMAYIVETTVSHNTVTGPGGANLGGPQLWLYASIVSDPQGVASNCTTAAPRARATIIGSTAGDDESCGTASVGNLKLATSAELALGAFADTTVYAGSGNSSQGARTPADTSVAVSYVERVNGDPWYPWGSDQLRQARGTVITVGAVEVSAPQFSVSPDPVDLGSADVGTTSAASTVTVTNTGTAGLVFGAGAVALSGAGAGQFAISADTCSSTTVAPSGTCTVDVSFAPTVAGAATASLDFTDNAPGSPQSIALTGTGTGGGSSGGGGDSGGGGGASSGGAGTPAPSPSPTASATPTQPARDPLAPVTNANDPEFPSTGLAPGGSYFTVNGRRVTASVAARPPSNPYRLLISGPGTTMSLEGRGNRSNRLGLTPRNVLILQSVPSTRSRAAAAPTQPVAQSTGDGFLPGSEAHFYLLPDTALGTLPVDDQGRYAGSVPVPDGLAPGTYTLQVNGFTPERTVRSLSLGVVVTTPTQEAPAKHASAKVYFAPMSAQLTPDGKAELSALARKVGSHRAQVIAVGLVQPSGSSGNDASLSKHRAQAVANYLRSLGVKGSYTVRGGGRAPESGAAARRVDLSITW